MSVSIVGTNTNKLLTQIDGNDVLVIDQDVISFSGVFWENGQTVTANHSIPVNKNAISAGPITLANGVTVTIPDGAEWTIV